MSLDEFDLLKLIGKGLLNKTLLVRFTESTRLFAMKAVAKAHARRSSAVHLALSGAKLPFLVHLRFVLDY